MDTVSFSAHCGSDEKEPKLVLASASPRRKELLMQIGVSFVGLSADIEEVRQLTESPQDYVARLAQEKATAVHGLFLDQRYYLGADTVVVLGNAVLEKPRDEADFLSMMATLSDSEHDVITGVCLLSAQQFAGGEPINANSSSLDVATVVVSSKVSFGKIDSRQLTAYWRTGEPADKAGGYAIQGFGSVFVKHVQGSYSNVVGLPLFETAQLLQNAGIAVWQQPLP